MRYLKPNETPIEINGKVYKIKFTLDIIDEIQDKTELSIQEIMIMTTLEKYKKMAVKVLLKYLIGKNIDIKNDDLDYYSFVLIKAYINSIKFKDMQKTQKSADTDDNIPFIDVEYWFYVGKVVLGFPSDEVWQMTIGQIRTLLQEHYKFHGLIKDDKIYNVDDVIPY